MTEASAHSDAEKACVRCNAEEDVLISLDCGHSFCLICMSYIVIKCRANGNSESQVVCPAMGCNKGCKLDERSLEAIRTTIQQTLLPRLNSIEEITEISSPRLEDSPEHPSLRMAESRSQARRNPLKHNPQSFQHSMEHITPSTRYLLSKGDSPVENTSYQEYCHEHPLEESSFVCLTCANTLLCVRCMMQQQHAAHNIKTVEKSIEYLTEQIALRKLEVNQTIDLLEIKQRRLQDKKELLNDKCNKARVHIFDSIAHIVAKAKKKEAELLATCQKQFDVWEAALNGDLENIKRRLFNLRKFKYDFRKLNHAEQSPSLDFFSTFNRLKAELDENLSQPPFQCTSPANLDTSVYLQQRDLLDIIDSINRMQLCMGPPDPSGMTSLGLSSNMGIGSSVNSVNNITVTNFTSKNNSAEKKIKQHLKTEQSDYVHLKTENVRSAGKLGTRCGSPVHHGLPAYITKFLEKHSKPPGAEPSESKYTSAKFNNSKFSFNALQPQTEEGVKKRGTIPKKRVERKTTNPLQSLKNQKLIFQNKKTRLAK